jgi:hypothetical protein
VTGVDAAAGKRPTLLQLVVKAVVTSFVYAPLGTLLAGLSFGVLWLILWFARSGLTLPLAGLWIVAGHALFITFLWAFAARSGTPLGARIGEAAQLAGRGAPSVAMLVALAAGLAFLSPWLALAVWALASLFAAPAHFARRGWSGWTTPPGPFAVPLVERVVLIAPSVAILGAFIVLLTAPGASWGFMDGGVVMVPLLGAAMFWASFSCALLPTLFGSDPA